MKGVGFISGDERDLIPDEVVMIQEAKKIVDLINRARFQAKHAPSPAQKVEELERAKFLIRGFLKIAADQPKLVLPNLAGVKEDLARLEARYRVAGFYVGLIALTSD